MKVTVRPSIRILGILLSILIATISIISILERSYGNNFSLGILISALFIFLPLVLSSCILGHVPYFLAKHIPEEMKEEVQNSEIYFTELSPRSIGFAIGFLVVGGSIMYFTQ